MVDAGRILIMPKGAWNNLIAYEMLDVVTQDNMAYIARQSSVGVSPKNDSTYTYWQPFGTAVTPDGTTIVIDGNNNFAVNIDNSTIKYDSTEDYVCVDASEINISDLGDITIASPTAGQVIAYDGVTNKWKNITMSLDTTLSGTLAAGATTLTFTDASIGNNSIISIFTDPYGIVPTDAVQSGTTVTLTFDPQSSAVGVKIVVKN